MPLCGTILLEKIKHPNFVMSIWKYAHFSSPPNTFVADTSPPDINFIPSEAEITEDGIIYPSDSDEELGTEE